MQWFNNASITTPLLLFSLQNFLNPGFVATTMKTVYLLLFILFPCYTNAESLIYLSNTAKYICEDSEGHSYKERFRFIHTLSNNVSTGDVEYYLNFLNQPYKKGSLREGEFNTLKNDLADKLLLQRTLPQGFTEHFLQMIDHQALGVVWRDYVLQKLPDLYERVEESERFQVLDKLWEETGHTEHTFSGTALLGLHRLSKVYPELIDPNRLAEQALLVVKADTFPEQNKITALRLAGELGHPEALNFARELLDSESSVMLRASAIGVLGLLGQTSDKEFLHTYAKSSDFRLRRAAESALVRLSD